MGKKRSRVNYSIDEDEVPEKEDKSHLPPLTRKSDEVPEKKFKWENKNRLLLFCSRGVGARDRHLMEDLRCMMPHSRSEPKHDTKRDLKVINEIAEMRNCNLVMYFETRSHENLYMWVSDATRGPSVKFNVVNVHTMGELKFTGNCLKGSRPLLKFNKSFDKEPHLAIIKELFVQIFGTPRYHPKSQPFYDHVFTFTYMDNRIWFRNYQILDESGEMAEIGPRFVLNPIKVFNDSFGGITLWENPTFKTPSTRRAYLNMLSEDKQLTKDKQEQKRVLTTDKHPYKKERVFEDLYAKEVK